MIADALLMSFAVYWVIGALAGVCAVVGMLRPDIRRVFGPMDFPEMVSLFCTVSVLWFPLLVIDRMDDDGPWRG